MARFKRHVEKTPVQTVQTQSSWVPFFEDWGRLVVPVGIAAILAALRLLNVIDDTALGYLIGILVLVGVGVAFLVMVWRSEFPLWVRKASLVAFGVFLAGSLVPFHLTVYPGNAVFQKMVSRDQEVPLEGVTAGAHVVEVYASELAQLNEARGEGQYRITVAGQEMSGRFADAMRSVRSGRRGARQVEERHLMDVHRVQVAEGAQTLKVARLDPVVGTQVRVSIYPQVIPTAVVYVLLALAMLFAMAMDGLFQEANERWRLGVFIGMGIGFLLVFTSAYERGGVTSAAIWSAIFGGVAGFLGGWLLSFMSRKMLGVVRTRF